MTWGSIGISNADFQESFMWVARGNGGFFDLLAAEKQVISPVQTYVTEQMWRRASVEKSGQQYLVSRLTRITRPTCARYAVFLVGLRGAN